MLPNYLWGPGFSDSSRFNLVWTVGMAQHEVYPRWLYGSFDGLGSPTFYFYPPLFFLISGKLHQLGLTVPEALDVAETLALASSGLAMGAWLRARSASPWWALLYMLLPYHLADLYDRGALAEFAGYIWPPLIALGIEWLPKRRGAVLLALAIAGLTFTHLPMAMVTCTFLLPPLVLARARADRRVLAVASAAIFTGLALSAVYLLPALGLLRHINAQIFTGPFYRPGRWSAYSALWPGDQLRQELRIMVAMGIALLAFAGRGARLWTWLTVAFAAGAIGLIPFWVVPPLDRVQFPWRLIGLEEFAAVTTLALSISHRRVLLAISAALAVPFILLGSVDAAARMPQPNAVQAKVESEMPDGAEYAPAGFPVIRVSEGIAHVDPAPFVRLPQAGGDIIVTHAGEVVLRRFNFPIWEVVGPRGPVLTYSTRKTGLLAFHASPGVYRVQRIANPLERRGWAISLVALVSLLGLALAKPGPLARRSPHSLQAPVKTNNRPIDEAVC